MCYMSCTNTCRDNSFILKEEMLNTNEIFLDKHFKVITSVLIHLDLNPKINLTRLKMMINCWHLTFIKCVQKKSGQKVWISARNDKYLYKFELNRKLCHSVKKSRLYLLNWLRFASLHVFTETPPSTSVPFISLSGPCECLDQ